MLVIPRVDTAPQSVEATAPLWLMADWLGLVEQAAPGEDKVPSPDHKPSLNVHFQQPGVKTVIPRVDTPRTMW